jgi:hypothetical protein
MAKTTFSGPVVSVAGFEGTVTGNITGNVTGNVTGDVTGDVTGSITLPEFTVATAPAATGLNGTLIYVSNGLAGAPTIAVSDGTDWISAAGTAIAAA